MTMNKNEQGSLVQKIRTQYTEQEHTKLDALRALDRRVKAPVTAFAYSFGIVGALMLGSGMSLIMTDIGEALGLAGSMLPGLVIGLAGMAMAIANYPIYRGMMARRRRKYAEEVLALSDELVND